MKHEDFTYVKTGTDYEKITHIDGVQTTMCANRFEIISKPTGEINEQQALQSLREWVRWRNAKVLSVSGDMPE